MTIKKIMAPWKYPSILLGGVGVSTIGAWVYFIALNVIVFTMTGSALAVAGLYIIKPLATLFTNIWAGSMIDRLNKKYLMFTLDIIRAVLIACLAFYSFSLLMIYLFVFFINMATSIYHPTSTTYITKLIPPVQRQRFNALRSFIDSGAFFIGPAIAGLLFIVGSPIYAIYLNAAAFFVSAFITWLMPNVEKNGVADTPTEKLSFTLIKQDWNVVLQFSHQYMYVMTIYFLFSAFIVMQTAIDSLEVAFSKEVLSLSDGEYGFLVSIAGAGILVGAFLNTVFAKSFTISWMIGLGSIMVSVGYIIYAFSNGFFIAAIGFFVLACANAFANTGYYTFYQNNIPVEVMGRVGSAYGLIEACLIIVMTILFGLAAHFISIQTVVIVGSCMMLLLTIVLCSFNLQSSKATFYKIVTVKDRG